MKQMPATNPLHIVFCKNIRAERKKLDLTHAELAAKLGISSPSYTQIETGRRVPSLVIVDRLAKALGVPAASLLMANEPAEVG